MADALGPLPAPPGLELLGPHGAEIHAFLTRPFLFLHRASQVYTARTVLGLLLDLGWEARLRSGTSLEALCAGGPAQTRKPLDWMLRFLAAEGLLAQEGTVFRLEGHPTLDLHGLRAACDVEAPGHAANFDLLDGVRARLPAYFTDGKPGEALLFDLAMFPLWGAYFRNENLVYLPNNLLTLIALREGLPGGARVLELGGGAGSFAQLVAQRGAREGWLGRLAEYRFSDVAPTFLRRAQRNLPELAPGLPLAFQPLDMNRPLGEQGIAPASQDAIVGVNVLHVARDLGATLQDLRSRLRPGGRLILGECVKPALDQPIYLEFMFHFLPSFTEVDLEPHWRPRHGFLTPEIWEAALTHAGFSSVDSYPPLRPLLDGHPTFTVGAFAATA